MISQINSDVNFRGTVTIGKSIAKKEKIAKNILLMQNESGHPKIADYTVKVLNELKEDLEKNTLPTDKIDLGFRFYNMLNHIFITAEKKSSTDKCKEESEAQIKDLNNEEEIKSKIQDLAADIRKRILPESEEEAEQAKKLSKIFNKLA